MRSPLLHLKFALFILALTWFGQAQATGTAAAQQPATLMEQVMKERPILAELLTKAGFAPLLSCDVPYTLLAPPESLLIALQSFSAEEIRTILSGHILKGIYLQRDLKEGSSIATLAGTKLSIFRKKDQTLVNGVRLVAADSKTRNGVIHGISAVMNM